MLFRSDGTTLAIDCIAVEDEYGNTLAQRAELDLSLIHIYKLTERFCGHSSRRLYTRRASASSR